MSGPRQHLRTVIAALCGIAYLATLHHSLLMLALLQSAKHEMSVVNAGRQTQVIFSHSHGHRHHDDEVVQSTHLEDHHHGDHILKLSAGEKSTLTNEFKLKAPAMMAVLCHEWLADMTMPAFRLAGPMRVRPPPWVGGAMRCLRTTVLVI